MLAIRWLLLTFLVVSITMQEVVTHGSQRDCWIVLRNQVRPLLPLHREHCIKCALVCLCRSSISPPFCPTTQKLAQVIFLNLSTTLPVCLPTYLFVVFTCQSVCSSVCPSVWPAGMPATICIHDPTLPHACSSLVIVLR